jgi:hypothetical protein
MTKDVLAALRELERRHGFLRPTDIVKSAKPKSSVLHEFFTWDDTKAAEERRLDQARALVRKVRVTVQVGPEREPIRIRAFVSMPSDRVHGLGYRSIPSVLSSEQLREILLQEAYSELARFRGKYGALKEMFPVLKAIERVLGKKA